MNKRQRKKHYKKLLVRKWKKYTPLPPSTLLVRREDITQMIPTPPCPPLQAYYEPRYLIDSEGNNIDLWGDMKL